MFSAMWWPSEKDQMRLLSLGHATLWGMRSFSLYMENYICGDIYMCMYEYRNSNHGNRKTVGFLTIPFCNNFYSCSLLNRLSTCGWITSSPWWSPHLRSLSVSVCLKVRIVLSCGSSPREFSVTSFPPPPLPPCLCGDQAQNLVHASGLLSWALSPQPSLFISEHELMFRTECIFHTYYIYIHVNCQAVIHILSYIFHNIHANFQNVMHVLSHILHISMLIFRL